MSVFQPFPIWPLLFTRTLTRLKKEVSRDDSNRSQVRSCSKFNTQSMRRQSRNSCASKPTTSPSTQSFAHSTSCHSIAYSRQPLDTTLLSESLSSLTYPWNALRSVTLSTSLISSTSLQGKSSYFLRAWSTLILSDEDLAVRDRWTQTTLGLVAFTTITSDRAAILIKVT